MNVFVKLKKLRRRQLSSRMSEIAKLENETWSQKSKIFFNKRDTKLFVETKGVKNRKSNLLKVLEYSWVSCLPMQET